jgi:GT2 family glycosyltransferase
VALGERVMSAGGVQGLERVDLSIVIVSFETRSVTLACLSALERARRANPTLSSETIVIDNGSRDGSAEAIARAWPQARLFACVRNRGFAAAVNLGLRVARGRHVLLLNSDVEIEPDVLLRGVERLDAQAGVGVLGVALLHPDGRPQRSAHLLPDLQSELLPGFLVRRLQSEAGRRRSAPARGLGADGAASGMGSGALVEVEAVRGAVFFVRGDLLEKVGLLDEAYFFFLEETDYCRRVREAGLGVYLSTDLHAVHRLGASSKRRAPLATRIEYHRSLYRYLARQHTKEVAHVVRVVRGLRNAIGVVCLALVAPFSAKIHQRLVERAGLLLWHLRGCPVEPSLARVMATLPPEVQGEIA